MYLTKATYPDIQRARDDVARRQDVRAALLDLDCKTIDHMRLANALCRFVELAAEV